MSASAERHKRIDQFFHARGETIEVAAGQVLAVQDAHVLGVGEEETILPQAPGLIRVGRGLIVARYLDGPSVMNDVAREGDVLGEDITAGSYRSSVVALTNGPISVVRLDEQILKDPRALFDAASLTNERLTDYAVSMRRPVIDRVSRAVHELADDTGLVRAGMRDLTARTGAGERPIGLALTDLARAGLVTLTGKTSKRRIHVNRPQA